MGWENSLGYVTVDRKTIAVLMYENRSVHTLFQAIVSQALINPIWLRQPDSNAGLIYPAGSRPWGQRGLAKTARMSINTLRRGLNRLEKMGLIKKVVNKLGTVIQVLNYDRFRRKHKPPIDPPMTPWGDTRVATSDPFKSSLTQFSNISSYVDVQKPSESSENWVKPEDTAVANSVRRMMAAITRGINSL